MLNFTILRNTFQKSIKTPEGLPAFEIDNR